MAFIDVLIHYGDPVNRETYLEAAYLGNPPADLDPESEAELQEELRQYHQHHDGEE